MKICEGCKTELPNDHFGWRKRKTKAGKQIRYRSSLCKLCVNIISNYRCKYHRILWSKLFLPVHLDFRCKYCGYNKTSAALEFHHRNPSNKETYIANILRISPYGVGVSRLFNELSKCDVLCANCHREIHDEEQKKSL